MPRIVIHWLRYLFRQNANLKIFGMDEGLQSYLTGHVNELPNDLKPCFEKRYLYAPELTTLPSAPLHTHPESEALIARVFQEPADKATQAVGCPLEEADIIYLDQPTRKHAPQTSARSGLLPTQLIRYLIDYCSRQHLKLCIRLHPERMRDGMTPAFEKLVRPYVDTRSSRIPFELLVHQHRRPQLLVSAFSSAGIYPFILHQHCDLQSLLTYPFMVDNMPIKGLMTLINRISAYTPEVRVTPTLSAFEKELDLFFQKHTPRGP